MTTGLLPLARSLEKQHLVATRAQLTISGVTDVMISRRVGRGEWQRLVSGVYALCATSPSTEQRRVAATLYAGENAQITGLSALHWYGFRCAPATEKVHLLVPHNTRRRSAAFITVQRTRALDSRARFAGNYWVTSVARAVVDAGRASLDRETVRAIMTEAVQSRFVGIEDLANEVRRAGRSRTAVVRYVLTEVVDGARSAPEAELRQALLASRKLPAIMWNPQLVAPDGTALPTPDAYLPDVSLAIEVDSRAHHMDDEGWRRTLRRANQLGEHGVAVLHFTPTEIRSEPARVRRVVERTYANRRASGAGADGGALLRKK